MRLWHGVLLIGALALAGCAAWTSAPIPAATAPERTPVVMISTLTTGPETTLPATAETTSPAAVDPVATETGSLPAEASPTDAAATASPSALPTPTFDPQTWSTLPVVPELSPRAVQVLREGLAKGNNPRVFSKIGDCESQASWFLGDFDLGPKYYSLGEYEAGLAPVIDYYSGSFKRVSLAARPGFTAASLMAPIWADKKQCEKDESPLACEYRINRPIIAFIMLGSNDASNPKTFEGHMRKIIEYSLAQGVLPVLGTKADNVEGDYRVNITIARLAYEYGIPLWNFWAAVQELPDHGLQADNVHLTFGTNHFDDPAMMKKAWPVRNLNALQILKQVMDQTQ